MKFSIEFTQGKSGFEDILVGHIKIGEFCETFEASLSFWNQEDYWTQWQDALRRLIGGEETSCLITSMYNPKIANFIMLWPLYRKDAKIFVQNKLLFLNDIHEEFDFKNLYTYIPQHMTVNEDGHKISEWYTNLDAINIFLENHDIK